MSPMLIPVIVMIRISGFISTSISGTPGIFVMIVVAAVAGNHIGGKDHTGNGPPAGEGLSESIMDTIPTTRDGADMNIILIPVQDVVMFMWRADGYIEEQ